MPLISVVTARQPDSSAHLRLMRMSGGWTGLSPIHAAELKRKERQLHDMRRSLEHLADSCHGDGRPDCPILGGLEGDLR